MSPHMKRALYKAAGSVRPMLDKIAYLANQRADTERLGQKFRQQRERLQEIPAEICPDCGLPQVFHNEEVAATLNLAINEILLASHPSRPEHLN